MCVCVCSGLCLETETRLGPVVERVSESQRPLMSDDDEDDEGHDVGYYSVEQPEAPQEEPPQPITFLQAFLLPGVLPVS